MPRTRNAVGVLVLKQVYSRAGHNYFAITIPTGIIDALHWEPGMLLQYYPTKDGGMKLINVHEAMKVLDAIEFRPEAVTAPKEVRGPRPGSFAEIQQNTDARMAAILGSLTVADRKRKMERHAQKLREEKKSKSKRSR